MTGYERFMITLPPDLNTGQAGTNTRLGRWIVEESGTKRHIAKYMNQVRDVYWGIL